MKALPPFAASLLLLPVVWGCATAESPPGAQALAAQPGASQVTEAPGASGPTVALPARNGPKKRLAVVKFENVGKFAQAYGDWDVGGGLAAQLTTALIDSDHFIVVERAALGDVLREQEMALEKVVSKETAARVGQVLGAQLLVKGAVTEFTQGAEGGGLRIGVGLPGVSLGGGGNTVSALVGIDLRLIDTSTGQVVRSVRAEGKAARRGVAATIDIKNVSLGGDAFKETPLGHATREAIMRAVAMIQAVTERVPWTGRVMEVADGHVYINAGQDAALRAGDMFAVTSIIRELTDPETGAVRGILENRVGQIRVEKVEEKFAIGTMVDSTAAPKRGDFVKQVSR